MKQTLFLFFTLVVTTMSLDDDYIEHFADFISLQREDAQTCVNKTNVTDEDIMYFNRIIADHLPTEFDDVVLKIGCLLACLGQKKGMMTGAYMKIDEIKKIMKPRFEENPYIKLDVTFRMLDKCSYEVKSQTNECQTSLKFVLCFSKEILRYVETNLAPSFAQN